MTSEGHAASCTLPKSTAGMERRGELRAKLPRALRDLAKQPMAGQMSRSRMRSARRRSPRRGTAATALGYRKQHRKLGWRKGSGWGPKRFRDRFLTYRELRKAKDRAVFQRNRHVSVSLGHDISPRIMISARD